MEKHAQKHVEEHRDVAVVALGNLKGQINEQISKVKTAGVVLVRDHSQACWARLRD